MGGAERDIFLGSWAIFGIKELSSAEGNIICHVDKINVKNKRSAT